MDVLIPLEEHRSRIRTVRQAMEEAGVDAFYLTSATDIFYLTGFSAVATERPAALVVPRDGPVTFLGPRLEESHVRLSRNVIEEVRTYFDYPGRVPPMTRFAGFLREMGLEAARLWADNPAGYGGLFGYRGPALGDELPRARLEPPGDLLVEMQMRKSPAEIALLEASARWGDRAMARLVEAAAPGRWDVEVETEASLAVSRAFRDELGEAFERVRFGSSLPVHAGFRGQVGPDSAVPHTFATRRRMQRGDVLGTGASAEVGGYEAELERTLVLGPPTGEQRRLFEAMVEAQDAAMERIGPGVPCCEVDDAAFAVLERRGVAGLALHHTGHGRGLGVHEPPYLDRGETRPLEPGMVLCVEPGLYAEGLHGFRHSDTVVVTADGARRITLFPRDLEACTLA